MRKPIQFLMLILCAVMGAQPETASAAPAGASAASAACTWGYYAGGKGSFIPGASDSQATSPWMARAGTLFRPKATIMAQRGLIDFDGDQKSDLFRLGYRMDGLYQWEFSPAAGAAFSPGSNPALAFANTPIERLVFADFNGNGTTDVFTYAFDQQAGYNLYISYDGRGSYQMLTPKPNMNIYAVRAGDFNGNGLADVLLLVSNAGMTEWWRYEPVLSNDILFLNTSVAPAGDLRLGDFNGDGSTDIFTSLPALNQPGKYQWVYSSQGKSQFIELGVTDLPVGQLDTGDFNGDGTSDIFSVRDLPDGSSEWAYWPGGQGPASVLQTIRSPRPLIGDFNGDGASDLAVERCPGASTFSNKVSSTLDVLQEGSTYGRMLGDLNGDGKKDLVWYSNCQGIICQGKTNILAAGLSLGSGLFTPITSTVVDSSNWDFARVVAMDYNGDGQEDVVGINPKLYNPDLKIVGYATWILTYTGSGFQMSVNSREYSGITYPDYWMPINLNNDGKMDIVHMTQCPVRPSATFQNFCVLSANNSVITRTRLENLPIVNLINYPGSGWQNFVTFVADINGDHLDDLVWSDVCQGYLCGLGQAHYLYTGINDGRGSFTLSTQQLYGGSGWGEFTDEISADFNGDGRVDLGYYRRCASASCQVSDNFLRVLLSSPNGGFISIPPQSFGARDWQNYGLSYGDVNGDGRADLVWTGSGASGSVPGQAVLVGLANTDGTFTLQALEQVNGIISSTGDPSLVDVSGDGRPDLVFSSWEQIEVLMNTATQRVYLPGLIR